MSRVITLGTFDLLHLGHIHLLQICRRIAGSDGQFVVAVNPDHFVKEFKGREPVQPFAERAGMVAAVRGVSEVVPTPGADAKPLLERFKPDFIVIGKDWADRDYYGQLGIDQEWLDTHTCVVLYIERVGDLSSTELKERVRATGS